MMVLLQKEAYSDETKSCEQKRDPNQWFCKVSHEHHIYECKDKSRKSCKCINVLCCFHIIVRFYNASKSEITGDGCVFRKVLSWDVNTSIWQAVLAQERKSCVTVMCCCDIWITSKLLAIFECESSCWEAIDWIIC